MGSSVWAQKQVHQIGSAALPAMGSSLPHLSLYWEPIVICGSGNLPPPPLLQKWGGGHLACKKEHSGTLCVMASAFVDWNIYVYMDSEERKCKQWHQMDRKHESALWTILYIKLK